MKKFILSVLACGYLVAGINDGLVAHYEFEGNAKDSSGNGNDGVEYGGVSYVDGVIGKAGSFDGVDGYIEFNNFIDLDKNFTIIGWYYFNDIDRIDGEVWDTLFSKAKSYQNGLQLMYHFEQKLFRIYEDGNAYGIQTINYELSFKKWYYITLSYNGSKISFYINNILIKEFDYSKNINDNYNFSIGQNFNPITYHLGALVDDFRIYNRALSEDEITELYNLKDNSNCNCDCSSQTTTNSELLEFNIKKGWNLMGSSKDITNLDSIFNKDCVNTIFAYDGSSWSKYMPNQIDNIKSINKHEGFWIYGNDNCTLTEELVPPSPN